MPSSRARLRRLRDRGGRADRLLVKRGLTGPGSAGTWTSRGRGSAGAGRTAIWSFETKAGLQVTDVFGRGDAWLPILIH